MAVTPYSPVNWTNGPVTEEKLQQMADNDHWLFENTPRMLYNANVKRSEGLKIACGKAYWGPIDRDWQNVTVYFGGFFSVGCLPVVVCTVQSDRGLRRLATTMTVDGRVGHPDHRGFVAHVSTQENYYGVMPAHDIATFQKAGGWLHWIAMGY